MVHFSGTPSIRILWKKPLSAKSYVSLRWWQGASVPALFVCLFARIRSTHHTSWKILQNISFSENKISPSITVGTIDVWRRRRHLQLCMRQKQKANEWYTSRPKNIPCRLGKDGHFSSFAWFPAFVANAMVLFKLTRALFESQSQR